jgi:hypothetical protein
MLDVSAFHSSTENTPQSKPQDKTTMARLPSVQASTKEACVPDSVERVEDSYQKSLPKPPRPPLPQLTENDDDEFELYDLSPEGRASLDAKTAAKQSSQADKVR